MRVRQQALMQFDHRTKEACSCLGGRQKSGWLYVNGPFITWDSNHRYLPPRRELRTYRRDMAAAGLYGAFREDGVW